jgi:hypothetical protein
VCRNAALQLFYAGYLMLVLLGCLETNPRKARKHFFLKKEAKTFAYLAYALGHRERLVNKSFLVLFFKKELLPFVSQPYHWWRSGMSQTQADLVLLDGHDPV